jgi:hypothetical protein
MTSPTSEAAIWSRVIAPGKNGMSREEALTVLKFQFSEADTARMLELATKNNEGEITESEREELESYVKVGDVLSLLHLKAKRSLKRQGSFG